MSLLEGMDRQQEGEAGSLQPYEVLRRAKQGARAAEEANAVRVPPCMRSGAKIICTFCAQERMILDQTQRMGHAGGAGQQRQRTRQEASRVRSLGRRHLVRRRILVLPL